MRERPQNYVKEPLKPISRERNNNAVWKEDCGVRITDGRTPPDALIDPQNVFLFDLQSHLNCLHRRTRFRSIVRGRWQ